MSLLNTCSPLAKTKIISNSQRWQVLAPRQLLQWPNCSKSVAVTIIRIIITPRVKSSRSWPGMNNSVRNLILSNKCRRIIWLWITRGKLCLMMLLLIDSSSNCSCNSTSSNSLTRWLYSRRTPALKSRVITITKSRSICTLHNMRNQCSRNPLLTMNVNRRWTLLHGILARESTLSSK